VNEGWGVSQHTLVYELCNLPQVPARGEGRIAMAVGAWQARTGRTSPLTVALKAELMRHWVDAEVVRLLQIRLGCCGPRAARDRKDLSAS
jgi:hypothetical protein